MQERFCTCGQRLQVVYDLTGFVPWEALIMAQGHGDPIKVCPCCGRHLSIHFLR
ncbi:hypothetical protein [Pseudodesulfovibrio tunisiensis]|uniref:hypothetical protein n=1 Tax=Pseudodesulfovibrio tunisiensis TaxID=463192 RepID=UPI001FB1BBEE|nr:hypothetical protein [Pseudodesulfovibrio tunisiensis]